MKDSINKKYLLNNKGSGLAVILYGVTLILVLLVTAINIINSKVIENGYNSLKDAVQAASSGSVIHLLTSQRESGTVQQVKKVDYDVYLQLALGYLINRNNNINKNDDTIVQSGELNNFIKLDHQKVVNSTLAIIEDAVYRRKIDGREINDTNDFKILMFFIEPYQKENGQKCFDIIAYGNGNYERVNGNKTITSELARDVVDSTDSSNMKLVYKNVEGAISRIVNENYVIDRNSNKDNFGINLNATGTSDYEGLIREMETYPHYLIVVKDFALPTIFDGVDTNDEGNEIKSAFSLSGNGRLKVPMCALNTGKIQRHLQTDEEKESGRWRDSIR